MRAPALGNHKFFSKMSASTDALGFLLRSGGLLTTSSTCSHVNLLGSQVDPDWLTASYYLTKF